MAGTLTIDTLKASTGVLATQNGMTGIAKAWVCFQGGFSGYTAGVINASFNISSITVLGTGSYQINFTTNMPSTAYTAITDATFYDGSVFCSSSSTVVSPLVSSFTMYTGVTASSSYNPPYVTAAVFSA